MKAKQLMDYIKSKSSRRPARGKLNFPFFIKKIIDRGGNR